MFMGSMVKEVLIPDWVKEIPRGFLVGCYELDHVILPPKVECLTEQVINVNDPHSRFRYIISLAVVPPPVNENMFGYRDANQKIKTIFVPDESVSSYKSADVWNWKGWNIYPISEFQAMYPHETAKDLQYYHII